MINSILLGKLLYEKLSNDEDIKAKVGNKIFPIAATSDTEAPFIVYTRTGISSNGCKDGYYEDLINFSIVVVSVDYAESLEIANSIRRIFEKRSVSGEDLVLKEVRIVGISESLDDDNVGFIQELNFECYAN